MNRRGFLGLLAALPFASAIQPEKAALAAMPPTTMTVYPPPAVAGEYTYRVTFYTTDGRELTADGYACPVTATVSG